MVSLQNTLMAKLAEAERLSEQIQTLPKSEEGAYAIQRWAVVADEMKKLMIQAEEQLAPAQLARLKAEINGTRPGATDLWAKYKESQWRLPQFGAPGPGDEPPPTMPMRDLFQ